MRPLVWMLVGALVVVLTLPLLPAPVKEYVAGGQECVSSAWTYVTEMARTASPSDEPRANPRELEGLIHTLVNDRREEQGLPPLATDQPLAAIARGHSASMARQGYFSHVDLAGRDPSDRAGGGGYECVKRGQGYYTVGVAENIFKTWLYSSEAYIGYARIRNWRSSADLARDVVDGWMESPGHRENILRSGIDREGVGVAIGQDDSVLVTQDFC